MNDKLFDVSLSESGKFSVAKTNRDGWYGQIYWGGNSKERTIGTYCKESNIDKTKKKLVKYQIKETEKELKKLNKYMDLLKSIL